MFEYIIRLNFHKTINVVAFLNYLERKHKLCQTKNRNICMLAQLPTVKLRHRTLHVFGTMTLAAWGYIFYIKKRKLYLFS